VDGLGLGLELQAAPEVTEETGCCPLLVDVDVVDVVDDSRGGW
jgi:hypothetical protein